MNSVEHSHEDGILEEQPLHSLDLPKKIRKRLNECTEASSAGPNDDVKYLWVHVTNGLSSNQCSSTSAPSDLSLEHWLNVVNEAASLGVTWFVISVGTALSDFPNAWKVCEWAQNVHGMTVGIHTARTELTEADVEAIKKLDGSKTRLLVSKEDLANFQHLDKLGIGIREADPRPGEQQAPCEKPNRMVFVNPQGQLYTCGLVEGNNAYHLGSVFNGTLDAILHNRNLPHAVSEQVPREGHGCDGCPPIMAAFFEEMDKAPRTES